MFIQSFTRMAACKTACLAMVFPGLLADFVRLCLVQGFFQDLRVAWFHSLFEFLRSLHSFKLTQEKQKKHVKFLLTPNHNPRFFIQVTEVNFDCPHQVPIHQPRRTRKWLNEAEHKPNSLESTAIVFPAFLTSSDGLSASAWIQKDPKSRWILWQSGMFHYAVWTSTLLRDIY